MLLREVLGAEEAPEQTGAPSTVIPFLCYLVGLVRETGIPVDYQGPGMRMWTRGDRSRYRNPASIQVSGKDGNRVWEMFRDTLHNAKTYKLKGEFGGSEYSDALVTPRFVVVRRAPGVFTVASKSVLRNVDVWQSKEHNPKEMG